MTKHLRLIMLSLLAMICMGGYSQSETVFKTLSFPDEDHANNHAGGYDKTWVAKIGNDTWSIANCNNNNWNNNWEYIAMGSKSAKSVASIATDTELAAAITKIVVNYNKAENLAKNLNSIKLIVASDKEFKNDVVTIEGNKSFSAATPSTFTITTPAEKRYFKLEYDLNKTVNEKNSAKNGMIQIKSIEYYSKPASSKTPTTTTFGTNYDGKTFTFVNGVLEGWKAPTATHTPADVAGATAYKSDNDAVAIVDANGQLTIKDYGKATITATFTPADTKTYAGSTASYTITNTKVYTSIADLKKDITTVKEKSFVLNLTNAIVTYTNRNSAFIQDESAGIFIYIKGGHKLEAGNTFTGTVNVKAMLYNDLAEITSWTSTVTPTQSEVPEPVVVTLAELKGDNYSKYESVRCKVVGVTVTKGMNVQNGEISQNGTIMPVRGGVANLTMTQDAILDMIGYPSIFNGTKQFQVWKNSDMTEHQTVKEITLDENSDNIVEEAKNVNVTLKRTLYGDGGWNTLCVPFSLTAAQVTAAFGNDVELRKLSSIEGTTLKFVSTDIITAGEPCLIKVAKDGSTYNFEGVATIAVANNKDYTFSMVSGDIQFLGIYSPMDVVTENPAGPSTGYYAFLGEGNKFFKAQAETKMKGFRAFFLVPNNVPSNALKAVIDGTATGIEDLVIDGVKANGRVYNLNGQYVGNSLNGLQPGLYIQNGKKIVVK